MKAVGDAKGAHLSLMLLLGPERAGAGKAGRTNMREWME